MLDPEGHVATWNAGAERFKGYTADEIIGQHFSQLLPAGGIDRGATRSTSWSSPRARDATRRRAGASARTARASGRTSSSPRCATPAATLLGFAQGHARPDRAPQARGGAAAERGALSAAGRERERLRHLHARPDRPRDDVEPGARSASRATARRRSSASTSRVLPAGGRRRAASRSASSRSRPRRAATRRRAGASARTARASGPTW